MIQGIPNSILFIVGGYFLYSVIKFFIQRSEEKDESQRAKLLEIQMNDKMEEFYKPPDWKERRKYVLKRDGSKCTKCGTRSSPHVHHVIPRAIKIDHSASNLITLCNVCHGAEHESKFESNESLNARWHLRRLAGGGRQVKARIQQLCNACNQPIPKGSYYILVTRGTSRFSIRDRYPGGAKLCLKCADKR